MANVQKLSQRGTSLQARKRVSRTSKIESANSASKANNTVSEAKKFNEVHLPSGGDGSDANPKMFQFVNITRPSDATNTEVSKTVRTQAMRDYLQKQTRQAITGVAEVVTSVKPVEPARYKGRFKLNTWSHKTRTKALNARREKGVTTEAKVKPSRKAEIPEKSDPDLDLARPKRDRSPDPVFFLDRRQIDPFDSLSIKLGSRSEGLLLHYHNSYSMNSVAVNPDGDFFSHAKTDPALLHSILYLVALHHDLKLGVSDSPESLYHGGEAFRVINQRLQDGVFTDMTIAAVAMLVTKENLNGNYDASKIHMQGLEYMVQKRGGIHMIKGVFRRVVTWSDFCYANVWNCQPRFPRITLKNHPKSHTLDFNPSLFAPEDLFGPESAIISIFSILRDLSSDLDPQRLQPFDRQVASNMIYNVEYELLHLNKENADDLEPSECLYAFEAVPLKTAAHLWLYLVIREVPRTSQLLHHLVERLQDALEIHLGGWWNSTYERQTWLLWMLFMGSAASAGRFERWWFVKELGMVCRTMGIWSREGLEEVLKRVLWQDAWCKDHVKSLWNDIVMMEEMKGSSLSPETFVTSPYSQGFEIEQLDEELIDIS